MDLREFVDRLDEELRTDAYADIDASANGLQVGPEHATIDRVAVAVDAAEATIDEAIDRDADVLVVHHGLSWGGFDRVTGREYRLIERLIRNDVALYVSHLPLDGHPALGNAAGVADALELTDREPFGKLDIEYIGQRGRVSTPTGLAEIVDTLSGFEREQAVQALDFGPETVSDVAIVTGSGTDWLGEAIACGVDVLITGEGKQQVYHPAREAGISVVLAGHYATETFGVRSIGDQTADWGLDVTYISHPTGI